MKQYQDRPFREAGGAYHFLAIAAAGALVVMLASVGPLRVDTDVSAFYCASKALLLHRNPYLFEPLHGCEAAHAVFFPDLRGFVVPAPLPPYGLAALTALAVLPFGAVRIVWPLLMLVALAIAARSLGRTLNVGLPLALAALGLPLIGAAFVSANLVAVPIAALIYAAYLLKKERYWAAAGALGVAMMEPHVALPACAAAFVLWPKMRLPLAVAAVACALVSLAVVAPNVAVSYVTSVLPSQGLAELHNQFQFSLSSMLYRLGVSGPQALAIGSAQYAVTALAGVWAARRLVLATGEREYAVYVPAAFAVLGGPFLHIWQIAAAIPFALALAVRYPSWSTIAALFLIALPWDALFAWPYLVPFGEVALLFLLWYVLRPRAVAAACALAAFAAVCFVAHGFVLQVRPRIRLPKFAPDTPAATAWKAYNDQIPYAQIWWPSRAPTDIGVMLLVAAGCTYALRFKERVPQPSMS